VPGNSAVNPAAFQGSSEKIFIHGGGASTIFAAAGAAHAAGAGKRRGPCGFIAVFAEQPCRSVASTLYGAAAPSKDDVDRGAGTIRPLPMADFGLVGVSAEPKREQG